MVKMASLQASMTTQLGHRLGNSTWQQRAAWPSCMHVASRRSMARATPASSLAGQSNVTDTDREYMRQALELAKRALGQTHPNPAVGCVLVKDGQVVGQGYHPRAGMPHAEVYALRGAGNAAAGATAYVTLEPCNHYGRTPPCSKALVDAHVARVVVGVGDPNPLVAAEGVATLQAAGIEVVMMDGPEQKEAYQLNADFMERMKAEALKTRRS